MKNFLITRTEDTFIIKRFLKTKGKNSIELLHLSTDEFMEFAEVVFQVYCFERKRVGLSVDLPAGIRNGRCFLNFDSYTNLLYQVDVKSDEREALKRLLSFSGTREDLALAKQIAERSSQHGISAMINIALELDEEQEKI